MTIHIAGFAGTLSSPSKTRALVELAATRIAARVAGTSRTHDLSDLQPHLGQAAQLDDLPLTARAVVDSLLGADLLIVGSPVYKGSYTGLFKHFFDLIDPTALAGKPVLLTATGGGEKHALIIEHQLRPLFGFFEASTLPIGVHAGAADLAGGTPASPALLARLDRAVEQVGPWLTRNPAPDVADAA